MEGKDLRQQEQCSQPGTPAPEQARGWPAARGALPAASWPWTALRRVPPSFLRSLPSLPASVPQPLPSPAPSPP